MRSSHVLAAFAVLSVLGSGRVMADNYDEVAPVRPLTMSDPAGLTAIALDFQYTKWTIPSPADGDIDFKALTFDLMADIRLAPHWVVLGRVPFSKSTVDGDPANQDCCDLALGNLTLGVRGLWSALYTGGLRSVVGGELTVSLPTASDNGDKGASAADAAFAHLPQDPGLYAPNTTTIKFNLLGQFYTRWLLLHGELGPQLYIYDSDAPGDDNLDVALHLGLVAGLRITYTLALAAELNSLVFGSNELGGDIESATSVDLGLRYASGAALLGLRVYIPLDSGLRDLDMIGVGADAGLRF